MKEFTDFVSLHVHTDRSALDSICKPDELVQRAKELGMNGIACTDHGVVAASIQLYKSCKKYEIKPIIGMESYLSPTDDHTLKEQLPDQPKQQCYHLTLLAKNADGVSQLFELSSRGFLEGFYYKPRISLPMIEEIGKDLIVMGACAKGPVCWNILNDHPLATRQWLERLSEAFRGRFYLEVMDHGLEWQRPLNAALEALANEFGLVTIPTNDVHFLKSEDHRIHTLMMCLQLKQTMETLTMRYPEGCYLKSPAEMAELFGEETCKRTMDIAEQIDIELELDKAIFPEFVLEEEDGI
jgi:DNA polymerase-3 subunit alpha